MYVKNGEKNGNHYVHDLGKRIKKQSTELGEYQCAKGSAKLYDP